ncbi:MAG TPA: hypothetical protein PKV72_02330 [Candidatus Peribacteria bacterium]|nr:hypothetical protein [Candidatus Peribacteria bacterium]
MRAKTATAGRISRSRPAKIPRMGGWMDFGLFVAGAVLITLFLQASTPKFGKVIYHYETMPEQYAQLPLLVKTAAPTMFVRVPMAIQKFSPRNYLVKPDDCIREMKINGKTVPSAIAKFCDYDDGHVLNLGKYLKEGNNVFEFTIHDDGGMGGINVSPASNDPIQIGAFTAFVLLFVWYSFTLVGSFRVPRDRRLLAAVFIGGLVLRLMYVIATPFRTRSYDVGGHLEYIEYIAKHWSIPLASNGWEFHQPPLYYWLSAVWAHVSGWVGRVGDVVYNDLQTASLVLSAATLLTSLWIARLLFPNKSLHKGGDAMFLALVAVLPGLVMFASRVTNESLYHFLAFLALAFLLAWWKGGRMRDWYLALLFIIIGSLTKISAAGLFPVAFVCFVFWKKLGWRPKLAHLALSGLMIVTLFAWYPVKRVMEKNLANVVTLGNKNMNGDLAVPRSIGLYVTFNPIKIAQLPFNDTWSEKYRRKYFSEFFYKSAFFGEFRFENFYVLGSMLVVLGMLLLPMLALGFLADMRRRFYAALPVSLTTGVLMAAALAYPTLFAYAPNQDFRFSVLLTVPFAYYIVRGIQSLPTLWRRIFTGILIAFAAACSVFFVAIYLRI